MFMVRQGDVLITQVDNLPKKAKQVKRDQGDRIILAYGEATGHHHAIADIGVEMFEVAEAAERWLRVGAKGVVVTHEEHGAVVLPAGDYIVELPEEYSPQEIRRVAD